MAVGGWRVDRRFGVIAAGVICFWTADTVDLIKAAEGTWDIGKIAIPQSILGKPGPLTTEGCPGAMAEPFLAPAGSI